MKKLLTRPLGKNKKSEKYHRCTLGLGSESMLPKGESKFLHCFKKQLLISESHPDSYEQFISHPGILAERQRQISFGDKLIIHPYSMFCIIWNSLMVPVNLAHMVIAPLRFCFVIETTKYPEIHDLDYALLGVDAICMLDIIIQFNVGVEERFGYTINLVRRAIAYRYLTGWFFFDLLSCLPITFLLMMQRMSHNYLLIPHFMALLRCGRLVTVCKEIRKLKIFAPSSLWSMVTQLAVVIMVTMHWSTCLIYIVPLVNYYVHGQIEKGQYCKFLRVDDIGEASMTFRYEKAMFMCGSAFFGNGYTILQGYTSEEILVHSFIILYSSIFIIFYMVIALKTYLTLYDSEMRYLELMAQLKTYMQHKQFPSPLKKRVMEFYKYRFQERYYKEENALECLSEQLRNELRLHTCHKLVKKVQLFEGLPASVVGTVLACLKPEVFMPNDLFVRVGELGECMYFIGSGTVAVYSQWGAEVCHLDDGDHFGEVALLMKDAKRIATVVAIEITEVYRLDATDFREFIMTYHELYERVETLASKRMHEVVIIDEHHRQHSRRPSMQPQNEVLNQETNQAEVKPDGNAT